MHTEIERSDADQVSVLDYYDTIADDYDQSRFMNSYGKFVDSAEREILSRWLQVNHCSVVDLGCGTGRLLDFAGTGVDGSEKMLQVAAKNFPQRRLVRSELTHLPKNLGGFEAAICFHVTMHMDIHQVKEFLSQASKIIKPGGRLVVDFLSKPRRKIFDRRKSGWHANTSFTLQEIGSLALPLWKIKRQQGILFFPIHRLPSFIRAYFSILDRLMGKSLFFPWCSYYVIELENSQ